MIFLIYMHKLGCSSIDSNQESIRDKYILGRDWLVTIDITHRLIAVVINDQY